MKHMKHRVVPFALFSSLCGLAYLGFWAGSSKAQITSNGIPTPAQQQKIAQERQMKRLQERVEQLEQQVAELQIKVLGGRRGYARFRIDLGTEQKPHGIEQKADPAKPGQ